MLIGTIKYFCVYFRTMVEILDGKSQKLAVRDRTWKQLSVTMFRNASNPTKDILALYYEMRTDWLNGKIDNETLNRTRETFRMIYEVEVVKSNDLEKNFRSLGQHFTRMYKQQGPNF